MNSEFRHLPSVDKVISEEGIRRFEGIYPRELLVNLVRRYLEHIRRVIALGKPSPSFPEIIADITAELKEFGNLNLRPVINATGVILHTNLGRAPLSRETMTAMEVVAKGYSNLEFDLDRGARSSREVHIESVLCQLSGAEAALVVNNNASGVLLALTAFARRKEVIISRGQAVEIGGSFRIPDVMRQSGAKLVEVGTTNCTYVVDYEQVINPRTAAIMRVHSSNFQIVGFTQSVTLEELVALGKKYTIPVIDDLGSGCFLDTTTFGLAPEPMVQQSVSGGAGLILFSGDKLAGGPQAGIIVGRKEFVDKLKKHPLARAVRIDKVRLAGLAATLLHYMKGEAVNKIPVWQMISMPVDELHRRAVRWAEVFNGPAQVIDGESMIGGGSLPGGTLPTKLVAISSGTNKEQSLAQTMARRLRGGELPIIGRISGNVLLLDPRSVLPEEDEIVLKSLHALSSEIIRRNKGETIN